MSGLDFEGLALTLLPRARELCVEWLPGGKMAGVEYRCGSIQGGPGKSFSVNTHDGSWGEFGEGEQISGGDFTSLYAAIHRQTQPEAYKILAERYSYKSSGAEIIHLVKKPENITPPPLGEAAPDFIHYTHGRATASWLYKTVMGHPMYWIARYDSPDGKQIIPWTWSALERKWKAKAYPEPRPLYNLDLLAARDDKPILIVEGEKTADAAIKLLGHLYKVTTWSGGAKALSKTDFGPLAGLPKVTLWPDADEPGWNAMQEIAERLHIMNVGEMKIVDTRGHESSGWDIADALTQGWDHMALIGWAKPKVIIYEKPAIVEPPQYEIEVLEADDGDVGVIDLCGKDFRPTDVISQKMLSDERKVGSEHSALITAFLKNKLIFDEASGSWFHYDLVWNRIMLGDFKRGLLALMRRIYNESVKERWFNEISNFLTTELGRSPSMNKGNGEQADTWNTRRELLPMKNGVLNLNTKELIPHSPKLMMNWCVPYDYDPTAQCPTTAEFLNNLSQGNEQAELLCLYFLWCVLHGRYDLQKYLELIGKAGAGKSTYLHIARCLVGEKNTVTTDFKELADNKYETANFYGKRLVTIPDAAPWGGSMEKFKAMTGGDPIRFEQKHKQQGAGFIYRGMVLVAGNQPIQTKEQSTAIVRRRLIVHIDKFFPDESRDPNIFTKLSDEMPGLVNWLLGLNADHVVSTIKGFKSPRAMIETDAVASWLNENCYYAAGLHTQIGKYVRMPDGSIENADKHLFPNFIDFLESQQEFARVGRTTFVRRVLEVLELHKYKTRKHKYNVGFVIENIRFRDENTATPKLLV